MVKKKEKSELDKQVDKKVSELLERAKGKITSMEIGEIQEMLLCIKSFSSIYKSYLKKRLELEKFNL